MGSYESQRFSLTGFGDYINQLITKCQWLITVFLNSAMPNLKWSTFLTD